MNKNEEKKCRDCFERVMKGYKENPQWEGRITKTVWLGFKSGWEAYKKISEAEND